MGSRGFWNGLPGGDDNLVCLDHSVVEGANLNVSPCFFSERTALAG